MRTLLQLTMLCVFVMHQVLSEEDDEENECGVASLRLRDGIISSPNFPHPYSHDLNCTYFIHVGRNNSVILKFLAFDLELPIDDGNCTRDWLTITCNETDDENLDFGKRLCGTDLPWSSLRFSNCPVVYLEFFADSSVGGGGFAIEHTVFNDVNFADVNLDLDCGTTAFTSSSGSISLPKNSAEYPARVNCTYTIYANRASRILLGIKPFQMPQLMNSFSDCKTEKIMVGCVLDGETELNPNTSNTFCRPHFSRFPSPPIEISFSNCTMLKISMQSSHYNYRADYDMPFTVHALDVDCGNTKFTGSRGIIKSPSFPQSYPNRLDCVYTIVVDRTKNITLDFISFHLEGTSNYPRMDHCDYDWLQIRCLSYGFVRTEPSQEYKHCGEMIHPITIDFSNCVYLTLNFVTDSSDSYDGFQILYIITPTTKDTTSTPDVQDDRCGNTSFSGPVGFITSPLFPQSYPDDMHCVYSIDVDKTKVTALYFFSFDLEGTSQATYLDSCIYDWLLVRCLLNASVATQNHRSRKYCGERTTPLMLSYSNCDSLTLYFVSDHSESRGGFRLRYTISLADEEDCGNTLFSGPNGVVISPNFPFPYPHNMGCKYSIDVGRNNSVLLKFKQFELEVGVRSSSTDFSKDWLMISCNETTKSNPNYYKKYRGSIRWTSSLRFDDCPLLVLEFVSDSTVNGEGFMIQYAVVENLNSTDDNFEIDCGSTLINSDAFIDLPINTKSYLGTVNCTYTIETNETSYFWLKTHMYFGRSANILQSFQDCDSESLTIGCVSEGETEQNPNTSMVFCRDRTPTDYKSDEELVFADCRQLKMSIRSTNYDNREWIRFYVSSKGQEELCGTMSFSDSSGTISSSRITWRSSKRFHCVYTIDNGHVNSVVLQLRRLNFHIQNAPCSSGWLTITCLLNGASVPHPLADRKLCRIPDIPAIRFPACRSVLLNYDTDFMSYKTEFVIRYRMGDYDPECGNTSFIGPTGVISSPQFQLLQKHHLNCLYSIIGGQKTTISLAFLSFNLEGTSNTPFVDTCEGDWLTVICLSDQSIEANISSGRRYCGTKTTPLKFTFRSCDVVVLNFQGDSIVFGGRFDVRYTVVDTESLCGVPVHGPPSGVFSFPLNTKDYVDNFDCNYVINATEPSSISLRIWSISHQSSVETNCQPDWLLFTCISDHTQLDHKVGRKSCDHHNSITHITFPSCAATQIDFHKDSENNVRTFRIEYTVSARGVVDTQMNDLGGQNGRVVGISLAVIPVVTGVICLCAFLILRLHRKKVRSQKLFHQASEEQSHITLELNDDTSNAGHRNDEQDTSTYLPLIPMTISDH